MPNRLAAERSPYLRQHMNNPVDWMPWGDEAFVRAESERKPIFLSVGYASCHWCHVMERECFEDEEIAVLLNRNFVSVKVDREELPEVDEAYMLAVQLTSGHGGWPASVFLTPDGKPFFGGTYFPKEDRGRAAGFRTVLTRLSAEWGRDPKAIQAAGEELAVALAQVRGRQSPGTFATFDEALVERCVQTLLAGFDTTNGGFGAAPKFPPHAAIGLLFELAASEVGSEELRSKGLAAAILTLDKMARGGIHDHVGGGFHRYSTDARWHLPHFEKMLYDNALLLRAYAVGAAIASQDAPKLAGSFVLAAEAIVGWAEREMRLPDGLFASGLDADSEGEEGRFYVWTQREITDALGTRAEAFCDAFGVSKGGNFSDEATGKPSGLNVLDRLAATASGSEFEGELRHLRSIRERRPRPARDDKALVCWNALMISGLCAVGAPELALPVAHAILAAEKAHGALPHLVIDRHPSGHAYLDDYAALILGLLDLEAALQAESEGLGSAARRLAGEMVELFYDQDRGGFYSTSVWHGELFGRVKPVFDQPLPSGNALAIECLLALGDEELARRSLASLLGWIEQAPQATESLLASGLGLLAHSRLIDETAEAPTTPLASSAVQVRLASGELRVGDDGWARGSIEIDVPEAMHLNGNRPPARWLTPTSVEISPMVGEVDYPPGDEYSGRVEIPFRVRLDDGVVGAEFEVTITYQACTQSECLAPQEVTLNGVVLR